MLKKAAVILGFLLLVAGCTSHNSTGGGAKGNERHVKHVRWFKQDERDVQSYVDQAIPQNSASVYFFRQLDDDDVQTSANLSVNGRFQSSLQPGSFSQTFTCTGVNEIGATVTGLKNNDLTSTATPYNMESGKTYFFMVDADGEMGNATVTSVDRDVALNAMQGMTRQSHQISRVVPNCPVAPARIELKVLFDTDKSFVKQKYYPEIQRVSDYMRQYPNTTAVIEGHTDSRASDRYNQALSQRRVDAVKAVLVNRFGVDASRLQAIGYGESRPVAPNNTREGRQQNRRVIAVFSSN